MQIIASIIMYIIYHNISNLIGSIHLIYNVYKHRINYIADFKIILYILIFVIYSRIYNLQ